MTDETKMTTATGSALDAFGGFDAIASEIEESESDVNAELSQEGMGGYDFVKFRKHGEQGELSPWEYGKDGEEIEIHPDSIWAVDINTMQHGWFGYEKKNGKIIKGKRPDTVWSSWTQKFPEKPEDKPWCSGRAFKWRAICVESPIPDQIGAYVENTDYRAMKEGYAELETELRSRIRQIKTAQAAGRTDTVETLMGAMYPTIQFRFTLGIKTTYGLHNKGIIKHVGWHSQVVVDDTDGDPEFEIAAEEVPEASEADTAVAKTGARRRRRRE